jgi:hypothetical protein
MIVNGEECREIIVTTDEDELLASITDENIIWLKGVKVVCVPLDD